MSSDLIFSGMFKCEPKPNRPVVLDHGEQDYCREEFEGPLLQEAEKKVRSATFYAAKSMQKGNGGVEVPLPSCCIKYLAVSSGTLP